MTDTPLEDTALLARVDTPDLTEALAADVDGSFTADVRRYLEAWSAQVKGWQAAGVSPSEYQELERLASGLEAAGRVIEFFAMLKKLTPNQPVEN